jgi:hypothetical protein
MEHPGEPGSCRSRWSLKRPSIKNLYDYQSFLSQGTNNKDEGYAFVQEIRESQNLLAGRVVSSA